MTGDLPPSSSVTRFSVSVAARLMILPTSVEPVKATLSTSRAAHQAVAGGLAQAGDEVEHAGREARLGDEVGEAERGQRGLLGGLEDERAAGGERGRDLLHGHHQREVPRHDLDGDADRLAADISVDGARPGSAEGSTWSPEILVAQPAM